MPILLLIFAIAQTGSQTHDPQELLGIWRGSSVCTDRQILPACRDEDAVYEFKPGPRPGVIRWIADKMVNGQRENMGESEISYDAGEHCWKAQVTPTSVWRLSVNGNHMTGTAKRVPGNETFRKLDLVHTVR